MGFWRGVADRLDFAHSTLTTATTVTLPGSGDLVQVASLPQEIAQAYGLTVSEDVVTRRQAMTIPAVRQGRNVIAGKIGTAPLRCIRTRAGLAPERVDRPFFRQPDPNTTRAALLTWTLDDLIFYPWAFWIVTERDAQRFPAHAVRVDPSRVRIDYAAGRVLLDGKEIRPGDVIAFQSPDEGLLRNAARTIKTALALEEAVRRFAKMEIPLGWFEDSEAQMEDDEITAFLTSWETYRATRNTGYVPRGLAYRNPTVDPQKMQLQEARNYMAAEIARAMNLPAYAVNAPSSDPLTYATTEGNRRDLVEISYAPYVAAVEQRLSMGDVTPGGTEVFLDFATFIRGDLKTTIETAALAVQSKLMDPDEVRVDWLNLPPRGSSAPTQEAPNGDQAA